MSVTGNQQYYLLKAKYRADTVVGKGTQYKISMISLSLYFCWLPVTDIFWEPGAAKAMLNRCMTQWPCYWWHIR